MYEPKWKGCVSVSLHYYGVKYNFWLFHALSDAAPAALHHIPDPWCTPGYRQKIGWCGWDIPRPASRRVQ
ncbi:hypothetical protein E2C01_005201 [Portunus trituberculatus]|uniref:Uncharacterized protein n=1 Tax=Portunus trituberculatus TaxID=210409 RepID=A0A5B7CYH7_PORTR|nr:hypothetical protein [Portunus trituberculatus]